MPTFLDLYSSRLTREVGTDDSTGLVTTQRRKDAVNEAQDEFADLTECLTRESTITITGGTAEYDLLSMSTAFVRLAKQGVEFHYTDASSYTQYLAGDDLPRRDIGWLNRYEPGWRDSTASTGAQTPDLYYLREQGPSLFLGFYPVPNTGSSASAQAVVPYVARPAPMGDDTSEPFTVNSSARRDLSPYHQALVHYAAHHLEKLRRDDEASDRQMQKFLGYVARFVQAMRPKAGTVLTFGRNYFRQSKSVTERRDPRVI